MSNPQDYPLTYALNEKNELVYVKDVARGRDCKCHCPYCNEGLDAKIGYGGHMSHFAHQSGRTCEGAYMSALHLRAQFIIEEKKTLMVPEYKTIDARRLEFIHTQLEDNEEWEGLRPDVLGISADGKKWAIEIFYSNKVDENKKKKIIKLGVSCVEIDVRKQKLEDLEDFLLNSICDKEWVNNPNDEASIQRDERLKDRKATKIKVENKEFEFLSMCDNLEDYFNSLNKYPQVRWKGRLHNVLDYDLSPDHKDLVIFHNSNRRYTLYYLTHVCFINNHYLYDTKVNNDPRVLLKELSDLRIVWESDSLPFSVFSKSEKELPF